MSKEKVKFLTKEDFIDISDEMVREYPLMNLSISNPILINVSKSNTHRIVTKDAVCYYVNPKENWYFRFTSKHENGFIF